VVLAVQLPFNRQRLYHRWLDELYSILLSDADSIITPPTSFLEIPRTAAAIEQTFDRFLGGHPINDP
jgi:3-hydroxyacyl-CoA dehydrogenase